MHSRYHYFPVHHIPLLCGIVNREIKRIKVLLGAECSIACVARSIPMLCMRPFCHLTPYMPLSLLLSRVIYLSALSATEGTTTSRLFLINRAIRTTTVYILKCVMSSFFGYLRASRCQRGNRCSQFRCGWGRWEENMSVRSLSLDYFMTIQLHLLFNYF